MSAMEPSALALFWAAVIVVAILAYVVLDGFDLGVGILFGATRDAGLRDEMIASISPFWDGNETWLIVVGATALIFRGVAFEFRARGAAGGLWDGGFAVGSIVAGFVQGAAVGAMIRGIPVANGQYSGGSFDWIAPLPILTGIGLVLGYALLGAGWLVLKSDDPRLRGWARERISMLLKAVVAALCLAIVIAFFDRARMTGSLFLDRPWGFIFPLIGVAAIVGIFAGLREQRDSWPFPLTVVLFVSAFLSLAVMFWPYMIPYSVTVASAAAPEASLSFLFWGAGLFVLPVIGVYTAVVYWAFRGRQRKGYSAQTDPGQRAKAGS
jgi:cytochrome d ubiquinol oxidase subunit II